MSDSDHLKSMASWVSKLRVSDAGPRYGNGIVRIGFLMKICVLPDLF
jgi:hypothetical protein